MKTLIELYDERPIENVLSTEVFRPERTIFLCPPEVAQDRKLRQILKDYFACKKIDTELIFLESSMFQAEKIVEQLHGIVAQYPDCVLDITGGTETALFACGQFSQQSDIPTFTYSRRNNSFYNIHRAPFDDVLECSLRHGIGDCFRMTGGAMREGRVDNRVLNDYMADIEPFFELFLRHRLVWTRAVNYFQRASQGGKGQEASLEVDELRTVKGEHGKRIEVPVEVLKDLESIGLLKDLEWDEERVRFCFRDHQIRAWLRDVGSVLELYIYQCCLNSGLFHDVRTSVVVDWEGSFRQDNVTNEIDVMAMRGILPVFISCKTCDVSTEALNELAILRDRFGGKAAKAAIVTAQRCRNITRHRASELGIKVIDLDDLKSRQTVEHLKSILRLD